MASSLTGHNTCLLENNIETLMAEEQSPYK